jgi:hypothetical protein
VIGADILYAPDLHGPLRAIFERNAAEVLIGDPYRAPALALLEAMERDGWRVSLTKWTVGVTPPPRPIGVFALRRVEEASARWVKQGALIGEVGMHIAPASVELT